jgi:hypothetical protein
MEKSTTLSAPAETWRNPILTDEQLRRSIMASRATLDIDCLGLSVVMLDSNSEVILGSSFGKPQRELHRDLRRHFAVAEGLSTYGLVTEHCAIVRGPASDKDPLVGSIFPPGPICITGDEAVRIFEARDVKRGLGGRYKLWEVDTQTPFVTGNFENPSAEFPESKIPRLRSDIIAALVMKEQP